MTAQTKVLLRGEDSADAISLIEYRVPAEWAGPPLQRPDFDETFYVLDGELTFQIGERLVGAGAGRLVFAPRGVARTLANPGRVPARYLLACTPAAIPDVEPGEPRDLGTAAPVAGPDGRVNVLVRGEDSEGRASVMDNVVPPGAGPPLHHHDFDEAFYVLDGELTFQLGDELVVRGPDELVFARRGSHHTFANLSGADARMLLICTPAGFERYFDRMAAEERGIEPPASALEPWPEVVKVGPPIREIEDRS